MKALRVFIVSCLVAGTLVIAGLAVSLTVLRAQVRPPAPPAVPAAPRVPAPPSPPAVPQPPTPPPGDDLGRDGFDERRYLRPVFRLGVPYGLGAGGEVSEVAVVLGDATIEGRVERNVVVVMGDLQLGPGAVVNGSVVMVGGAVTVASGASVGEDLVIVAGSLDAPAGFMPLGQHVVVGPPMLGDGLRSIVPWFTRGLLWGRVIVPSVGWIWSIVFISLLIFVALGVAFPRAVHACAETLVNRPLSAFFVGIMTLLLVGPITVVLAASVVGLIVVPFAFCALVVGWMLGKVGVAEWIGGGIIRQDEPESRLQTIRSLLIGFVIITVAYAVPLIGLAAWALVGVFGLGTATITFFSALKRERPAPKPKPAPPVAPPQARSAMPTADLSFESGESVGEPAAFSEPPVEAVSRVSAPPVSEPGPSPRWVPPTAHGDLAAYPRATFLDRLGAFALDVILALIVWNFLDLDHAFDDGMFFVVLLAYHMAFWTWKGTTVGGIVCSIRVIRIDGGPVRPVDAVVRGLSSLFSIAALGIGFFWILLDGNRERQAWHDKIAGTLVVRVPRDLPL